MHSDRLAIFSDMLDPKNGYNALCTYFKNGGDPNVRSPYDYSLVEHAFNHSLLTHVRLILTRRPKIVSKASEPLALNVLRTQDFSLYVSMLVTGELSPIESTSNGFTAIHYLAAGFAGARSFYLLKLSINCLPKNYNFPIWMHNPCLTALSSNQPKILNLLKNSLPHLYLESFKIAAEVVHHNNAGLQTLLEQQVDKSSLILALYVSIRCGNFIGLLKLLKHLSVDDLNRPCLFDPEKFTPIHFAAYLSNVGACFILLRKGVNLTVLDANERTPFMLVTRSHNATREAFIRYASSDLLNSIGKTDTAQKIELLLSKCGADPNITNSVTDQSALEIAARAGDLCSVMMLIKHGANVQSKSSAGKTVSEIVLNLDIPQAHHILAVLREAESKFIATK